MAQRRLVTGEWTQEEMDTLKALAPTMSVLEIATRLEREWRSVKMQAFNHNIPVFTDTFKKGDARRYDATAILSDRWHRREDRKLQVYQLRIHEHTAWGKIADLVHISPRQVRILFDEACQDAVHERPNEIASLQREQQEALLYIQDTFLPTIRQYKETQSPGLFPDAVEAAKTFLNAHDRLARLTLMGAAGKKNPDMNVLIIQNSESDLMQFAQRLRAESETVDAQYADVTQRGLPAQHPKDQPPPTDSSDDVAIPDV